MKCNKNAESYLRLLTNLYSTKTGYEIVELNFYSALHLSCGFSYYRTDKQYTNDKLPDINYSLNIDSRIRNNLSPVVEKEFKLEFLGY